MTPTELKKYIASGGADEKIAACGISQSAVAAYRRRVCSAVDSFAKLYGDGRDAYIFSVGGRSEISGNHVDHQHGRVIAAAVNLDIIAVASPNTDGIIRLKSEGFDEDVVSISPSGKPDSYRKFSSASIIAGMANGFEAAGFSIGGFDAYTTSAVLKGSGLSSSAAFEVMVGCILNELYNGGSADSVFIAKTAQRAENLYFGKPCGLMDQTACAVGGFITIDFADVSSPVIEKLPFDLTAAGYGLCIIDTGGNHADLGADYASVPSEMREVAAELGAEVLRDADEKQLISRMAELREKTGDRALLRALHFYDENRRVKKQVDMLRRGDASSFLREVTASGNSSFKYLQNVYTVQNPREQGLSLALALAERYLDGCGGAARVHGGGFAGTIQAFVPLDSVEGFAKYMESVFGDGTCHVLSVRDAGGVRLA
jgi:galactokinase